MSETGGEAVVRRSTGQRLFYFIAKQAVRVAMLVFFRLRRFDVEKIPRSGACLLVSNHQSFLDPPIIGLCVRRRQFHSIARSGLFESPRFASLIRMLNAIPVREDGKGDAAAMRRALALLNAGEVVLIFPEGSRTDDGSVGEFKRGVGILLKRARCPVVPMAIEGAYQTWPRGRRRPRLFGSRISVIAGDPIGHDELLQGGADAALDRLREEVTSLQEGLRRRRPAVVSRSSELEDQRARAD